MVGVDCASKLDLESRTNVCSCSTKTPRWGNLVHDHTVIYSKRQGSGEPRILITSELRNSMLKNLKRELVDPRFEKRLAN